MTDEQKDNLAKAGQLVKEAFPQMYGSVKFNLSPNQKKIKVKYEEDLQLEIPERKK